MHACEALYENIVKKQMYITGSIGSSGYLERFTTDYDLPNAMNYSESCASIGLALFARRMAQITHDAGYMDTAECALYNTVTAGIALDGKSFFYVNPLAVWPAVCMERTSRSHVKSVRQKWFACACCPPNIARTLASIGEYCYFTDEDGLWINLFVSGEFHLQTGSGMFHAETETKFPFGDTWRLKWKEPASGQIRIRIPRYVRGAGLCVTRDGDTVLIRKDELYTEKGYAVLNGDFEAGDTLEMRFDIPPVFMRANLQVRADAGRVALKKGPLVYCLEQTDNGENLEQLIVDPGSPVIELYDEKELGGTLKLQAEGYRCVTQQGQEDELYTSFPVRWEKTKLTFVPYAFWGNRIPGEMAVWVRELQQDYLKRG